MLHSNATINVQLHKALYNKTIDVIKETNLPFIIIDEVNQYGENFGEKFCNAIEYCFGRGYNNLITIGSDCAALTSKDILRAHGKFQNNINSIGADNHGGFYLLALQKKDYHRTSFLNFEWNSKVLFKKITAYFKNILNSPLLLHAALQDINTSADLDAIANSVNDSSFIKLLKRLCKSISDYSHTTTCLLQNIFSSGIALRGPPAVSPL